MLVLNCHCCSAADIIILIATATHFLPPPAAKTTGWRENSRGKYCKTVKLVSVSVKNHVISSYLKNSSRPVCVHIWSSLGNMIITDSRCKHELKCYSNNSSQIGQWVPKHFHIITAVVPVTHLEFIRSGRLTPQQLLWNIGSTRRVTAECSAIHICSVGAAKTFLYYKCQIVSALLKSSFSPWAPHQRQKRWKLHVRSNTHYRRMCRQGEPESFIMTTANFL